MLGKESRKNYFDNQNFVLDLGHECKLEKYQIMAMVAVTYYICLFRFALRI
jgi:hypothetical protein